MLTSVSTWTIPSFNLSMFTEDNGSTINNEDERILNKKKKLKCAQFCITFKLLSQCF